MAGLTQREARTTEIEVEALRRLWLDKQTADEQSLKTRARNTHQCRRRYRRELNPHCHYPSFDRRTALLGDATGVRDSVYCLEIGLPA